MELKCYTVQIQVVENKRKNESGYLNWSGVYDSTSQSLKEWPSSSSSSVFCYGNNDPFKFNIPDCNELCLPLGGNAMGNCDMQLYQILGFRDTLIL